jgi:hypothetical protein
MEPTMDLRNKRTRNTTLVVCLGVAAAALVAVTVFGVPTRTILLYGAFALCPLMHLFMGHGAHGAHQHDASEASKQLAEEPVASAPDQL